MVSFLNNKSALRVPLVHSQNPLSKKSSAPSPLVHSLRKADGARAVVIQTERSLNRPRMGCWFSRFSTTAKKKDVEVEVVNNSQLGLHVWVNGGGPVCKCPPGKTTTAPLPAYLSHGRHAWTATLDLPDVRSAGMQGLHVCTWNQVMPRLERSFM